MESSHPSPAVVLDLADVDLEALTKLREKFPDEAIGKLPKGESKDRPAQNCNVCHGYHRPCSVHLDFVGHAEVTDRLLTVDPMWTWEPMGWENGRPALEYDDSNRPVGLWIWLYVGGLRRPGYGSVTPGKFDAVKELIGDALRNAAMRFGVALNLWSKAELESFLDGINDGPAGTPTRPQAVDSGGVKVASKRDRDAIVALLNTIPEENPDPDAQIKKPRLGAKRAYLEMFQIAAPDKLPADKVGAAKEWAAGQVALYAPVGSPDASEGAGPGPTPGPAASDPAPAEQATDPANLRIGVDAYLDMLTPDEVTEYEAWRKEKFMSNVELADMDAGDLQATWEWLANKVEPYNNEEQT